MISLKTKQPVYVSMIFSMSLLAAVYIWIYFNSYDRMPTYLICAGIALLVAMIEIVKWFSKTKDLIIEESRLTIGGTTIHASDIKTLHIEHRRIVGLKPHHKWIVTPSMRFELVERARIDLVEDWAKENGVKIRYGRFAKWL